LALECCLEKEKDGDLTNFSKLMQARVSYLKDQNLSSSVVHLKDASLSLYQEYIDLVKKHHIEVEACVETVSLLLVE
jgi:hypothetical protein